MTKYCSERYNKIIKITRLMAWVCGADIVDPNYKMSWLTWTVIIAINTFFCCTIYTIYMGLVVDGDWKVLLQALTLVGSGTQGYSKMIFAIHRRLVMISMCQSLDKIYKKYQNDKDYLETLTYRIDLNASLLKILLVVYILVVLPVVLYPALHFLLYGEKLFVMQLLIPGIDHTTHFGYTVHYAVHSVLMFMGGFGNFAADLYIFIFIIHIPLLKDILSIKFKKLNQMALQTQDPKKTLPLLQEIVEWHQNYNKFVRQVEHCYYVVIFVQVFSAVLSISCSLFCIATRSWPAAFFYFAYSTIMLYAYCGLGHMVEIANDELMVVIYGDCKWYELTVPEQKLVLLMLRKSQRPTTLSIGQIMPLSMSTALQLTKAVYSYMMMLLKFLENEDM